MTNKLKVDVCLDDLEVEQLKELHTNDVSRFILASARDFFDFDFRSRSVCDATICFELADRDETNYGATLRKITKPPLLNLTARGPEKEAINFLEHLLGTAVLTLRNYNCAHGQECIDFVAEKRNLNSSTARESRKSCLGFSCTQCQFYQSSVMTEKMAPKPPERCIVVKQLSAWEVSLRNSI